MLQTIRERERTVKGRGTEQGKGKGLKKYTIKKQRGEREGKEREGEVSTYIWPPPSDVHPRTSETSVDGFS
jgi:hypothetical protein